MPNINHLKDDKEPQDVYIWVVIILTMFGAIHLFYYLICLIKYLATHVHIS